MSDVHFDRAALDACVRYLEREATTEALFHALTIRKAIVAHESLADRFLEQTAELRASASRMREIAAS